MIDNSEKIYLGCLLLESRLANFTCTWLHLLNFPLFFLHTRLLVLYSHTEWFITGNHSHCQDQRWVETSHHQHVIRGPFTLYDLWRCAVMWLCGIFRSLPDDRDFRLQWCCRQSFLRTLCFRFIKITFIAFFSHSCPLARGILSTTVLWSWRTLYS